MQPIIMAGASAALVLLALMLLRERETPALRRRVVSAGTRVAGKSGPAVRRPEALVIRAGVRSGNPVVGQLLAMLGHRPELASGNRLGWPLIVMLALSALLFTTWFSGAYIGALNLPCGLLAGVMTSRSLFGWERRRYRDQLFGQIPDAIGLVIRAITAGVQIAEALRSVAREMPEPTRTEFTRVAGEIAIGRSTDQAIWQLYHRTGLTEYSYLAVTLGLQAQTGGRLAETLENLADMVRKRVAMAKRGRALAAEARMSTTVLVSLPFVSAAALAILRPGYLDVFVTEERGSQLLMIALALLFTGLLTIRWLTRRSLAV